MNRIYQGRVSRVQRLINQPAGIKTPKGHGSKPDDWCEWPAGEEALWQHHELFQDAVNYYLVALLACAISPENPLFEIRQRVASDDAEYQIWASFRRRGVNRKGLRESVAKYLTPGNPTPTWNEAVKAVLGLDCAEADVVAAAVQELLAICDGGGAIQQEGRAMFPRFCAYDYAGGFPLDAAAGERESVEALLTGAFHDITDERSLAEFAKLRLHIGGVVNLAHDRSPFAGEPARERLLKAVDHFRQVWEPKAATTKMGERVRLHLNGTTEASSTFEALRAEIISMPTAALPEIPANQRSIPDRLEAALLFKFFPRRFTADLLRVSFPRAKVRKFQPKEIGDAEKAWDKFKRVVASRFSDDPIKLARGNRGYVFRAFTSLRDWNPAETPAPQWREFDIAAFKYALTALNQIEDRGNERRKEQLGKQARLDFMRGDGSAVYRPTSESDETPARIHGDPRIERLEAVLTSLREVHWMSEGETSDYGLQPRTIRGFRDLRRLWRHAVGTNSFSEELHERLRRILNAFQTDNATIVGSVRLFEALMESDSWIVWQEQTNEITMAWAAKGFAEDPLEALVEERQLREEIERLGRPVRLTPADPLHSRRQYDFNAVSGFKAKGTCHHEPGALAFTTEIAMHSEQGWQPIRARIVYSAPRFLRDGLRGAVAENLAESRWLQPMMEALAPTPTLTQDLTECAVCLMPDVLASGERRLLLNFPVTLEPAVLQAQLGRLAKWKGQLYGGDKEPLALRWKEDDWPENETQPRWYQRLDEFHVMSVDLGQRDAGAFAVLHCTKGKASRPIHRAIGSAEDRAWFASVIETGLLRLPGEDACVWRDGQWQEELSGEAGRLATADEWAEACRICSDLRLEAKAWLGEDPKKHTFPELNDRLLAALRRAQAQLARLQSWSWRCVDPVAGSDCRQEIRDFVDDPDNLKPLAAEHAPVAILQQAIVHACAAQRERVQTALVALANRVLPLRGREWRWIQREGNSSNHVLVQTEPNSDPRKKKLAGQRGLSLERLEQLEELRRRCLSLNRALQQTPGTRGALGRPTRGLEIPDPCPLLLEKIERLRDQRVDQTAHLILARALGLKLSAPRKGAVERQQRNIHGEYERFRDPVDFIVLEDLSRYLSSQGRSRAENSRLMQWCHRQILEKLRQLAESYGLKVLQTGAAYSSRFCSRSGGAGFRAVELTPRHREYFPWRRVLDKLASHEGGEKHLEAADLKECLSAKTLFDQLDDLNRDLLQTPGDRPKWRTLLAPIAGGPIFIPMVGVPVQADINAAINLGLRAVANPRIADIHLRIRTKREGRKLVIRTDSKREKTRWRESLPSITISDAAVKAGDADRSPNVFADIARVANYDRAILDGIAVPFALGRGLWGCVKEKAWDRCQKINSARLAKWRNEQPVAGHPEI